MGPTVLLQLTQVLQTLTCHMFAFHVVIPFLRWGWLYLTMRECGTLVPSEERTNCLRNVSHRAEGLFQSLLRLSGSFLYWLPVRSSVLRRVTWGHHIPRSKTSLCSWVVCLSCLFHWFLSKFLCLLCWFSIQSVYYFLFLLYKPAHYGPALWNFNFPRCLLMYFLLFLIAYF